MTQQQTIEKIRFFSPQEYQRRLDGARRQMAEKGVDTLLGFNAENNVYMCGYQSIGYSSYQCLIIPASGPLTLLVREMETGAAMYTAWVDDIIYYSDHENPVEVLEKALRERGLVKGTIGMEYDAAFIGAKRMLELERRLQNGATIVDASGTVEEVRMIKSDEEIVYSRKACETTRAGMLAGLEATREGVTENQISAAMYDAAVNAGSVYMSSAPIVTSGPRSGVAHTTFEGRTIIQGDVVLLEMGGIVNRYGGGLMRSVAIGKVPDEVHRMAAVCKEALEAGMATIKPGVPASVPHETAAEIIRKAGYEQNFRKRFGYSCGVSFPPDWGEGHIISMRHGEERPLQPGMIFHMPPALRQFGQWGVGTSETILVTPGGYDVLTLGVSRDLFLK